MPQPHKSSADDSLSKCHRLCLKFLPLHQRPPLNLQDSYTSCETRPLHVHRGCASPESWHGGPPLGCGCGFVPLQAFSHDPPLSPTSLLQGTSTVHLGSRVQLGAGHCHFWLCAHRVCVCVCVSPKSLQFPTLQLQFTHKASLPKAPPQNTVRSPVCPQASELASQPSQASPPPRRG